MNFNEFKAIMCDLRDLNYITFQEYKDHCFVRILRQDNDETTSLVLNKIINIWKNSGIIGGYGEGRSDLDFVFVETENFSKCFTEENYEKIVEKINELNPSFCHAGINGKGMDKVIRLSIYHTNGDDKSKDEIYDIIKRNLPKNTSICAYCVKTKKGIAWEQKKMNCAEIKICEDFDRILSRF